MGTILNKPKLSPTRKYDSDLRPPKKSIATYEQNEGLQETIKDTPRKIFLRTRIILESLGIPGLPPLSPFEPVMPPEEPPYIPTEPPKPDPDIPDPIVTEPTDPSKPTDPNKPTDPSVPDDPNVPIDPDRPGDPSTPVTPIPPVSRPTPQPVERIPTGPYLPPEVPGRIPIFTNEPDPRIDIKGPANVAEFLEEEYDGTLDGITTYVANTLNVVVSRYLNELMKAIDLIGDDDVFRDIMTLPYSGHTKDVPVNMKHLSDMVIRTEIERDNLLRLYKKTHSADRSLYRFNVCQVSRELEERYHEIKKNYELEYLQVKSDDWLDKEISKYEKKCDRELYQLFKYLNSGVITIDECLKCHAKEVQAKTLLYNAGVEVYKIKEEKVTPDRKVEYIDVGPDTGSEEATNTPSGPESPGVVYGRHVFTNPLKDRGSTSVIIVHHAASAKNVTADDIHRWHLDREWYGIGYHFVISYSDGKITTGRPVEKIGAHAEGRNYNSIGICLVGNMMKHAPSAAQISSLISLCIDLEKQYKKTLTIEGHHGSCPGVNVDLGQIRQAVKDRI